MSINSLSDLPVVTPTSASQLFFEVWTMTGASSGATFVLLQFGHRVFAFSRSAMVMISSNALSHFSHMNS